MRVAWGVVAILVVAVGCQWGRRTPPREQERPYDLVPQSGYLAEGTTVSPEYAPMPSEDDGVEYDEAAYREAIRKDLVRINALLTENDRLRQELVVATVSLNEARDEIERLRERVAALEAELEQALARAERRAPGADE